MSQNFQMIIAYYRIMVTLLAVTELSDKTYQNLKLIQPCSCPLMRWNETHLGKESVNLTLAAVSNTHTPLPWLETLPPWVEKVNDVFKGLVMLYAPDFITVWALS